MVNSRAIQCNAHAKYTVKTMKKTTKIIKTTKTTTLASVTKLASKLNIENGAIVKLYRNNHNVQTLRVVAPQYTLIINVYCDTKNHIYNVVTNYIENKNKNCVYCTNFSTITPSYEYSYEREFDTTIYLSGITEIANYINDNLQYMQNENEW